MPPIFLHMAMARDIAAIVDSPVVGEYAGEFYFGATTPDIRVLTREDRSVTHYYDLAEMEHQDSVAGLFAAHPELSDADALAPRTASFMSGYVTHLCLDQRYIDDVYRPYFGQRSALGGDLHANTMDRLLQFELDRQRREDTAGSAAIREALEGCSLELDVGFLSREILEKWLQVAIEQTHHPPDWRRFRFQGGRHLPGVNLESDDALDEFLQRVPELLQQTIEHVSTAQVDAYVEQARESSAATIRRYLGVP